MIDVVEILQHWHAGRRPTEVAASLGVDPRTVRKYTARAADAGIVPGGPPLIREQWVELVRDWFPELVDARVRSLTYPEIDAHRAHIEAMLETNTVSTIWQRLRDEHGLTAPATSVRRYVWREFPDRVGADQVTVWRPPVEAGDEAQIDYGYLGAWFDPVVERVRRVWAFIMVLACSRHMFVRPVLSMNQSCWVEAHVAAFEFFAGCPARLVPDNLKTGVVKHPPPRLQPLLRQRRRCRPPSPPRNSARPLRLRHQLPRRRQRASLRPHRRPTAFVTQVIDGDTVVIDTGQHIRLVGIDAPERGHRGYDEATATMRNLVYGKRS